MCHVGTAHRKDVRRGHGCHRDAARTGGIGMRAESGRGSAGTSPLPKEDALSVGSAPASREERPDSVPHGAGPFYCSIDGGRLSDTGRCLNDEHNEPWLSFPHAEKHGSLYQFLNAVERFGDRYGDGAKDASAWRKDAL